MQTAFDWLALVLFSALAMVFLSRSIGKSVPGDRVVHYLPGAIGCAVGNLLGNAGHELWASVVLALAIGYSVVRIRPWIVPR